MDATLESLDDVLILTPGKGGLTDQSLENIDTVPGVTFKSMYSAETKAIIVDLKNVSFLDSHGFGMLAGMRSASVKGCIFVCCGMSVAMKDLMTMTRLKDIAELHKDRESALASLQ